MEIRGRGKDTRFTKRFASNSAPNSKNSNCYFSPVQATNTDTLVISVVLFFINATEKKTPLPHTGIEPVTLLHRTIGEMIEISLMSVLFKLIVEGDYD